MNRKEFLLKVIKSMKGYATAAEIKEEYDALSQEPEKYGSNPQVALIKNIVNWITDYYSTEQERYNTIFERLVKEQLIKTDEGFITEFAGIENR